MQLNGFSIENNMAKYGVHHGNPKKKPITNALGDFFSGLFSKKKKNSTPLFTGKEPEMLLSIIPGGSYATNIIKKEYNRMMAPPGKKGKDTYFEDLIKLPVMFGKDVKKRAEQFPSFLVGSVATPALTISDAFGGKDEIDLGFFGTQKSLQKQRKDLLKSGAGSVFATAMPVIQLATAVKTGKSGYGVLKKTNTNILQPAIRAYKAMSPAQRQAGFININLGAKKNYTPMSIERINEISAGFKPGQRLVADTQKLFNTHPDLRQVTVKVANSTPLNFKKILSPKKMSTAPIIKTQPKITIMSSDLGFGLKTIAKPITAVVAANAAFLGSKQLFKPSKNNINTVDYKKNKTPSFVGLFTGSPQTKEYVLEINPKIGLWEFDPETKINKIREYTDPSEVNLNPQVLTFSSGEEVIKK